MTGKVQVARAVPVTDRVYTVSCVTEIRLNGTRVGSSATFAIHRLVDSKKDYGLQASHGETSQFFY